MKRTAREKVFSTETEMCAAFIAALPTDWTAYNETAGWDILLVRDDGFQVGIEAKLRLNAHVIAQAIEKYGSYAVEHAGPDCRAVLVPDGEGGFGTICAYIGLTIIRMRGRGFEPPLPGETRPHQAHREAAWHEWCPAKRHKLPEYVPDVPAGTPSPRTLSQWKIKALKLSITLENRGYLVRADFSHLQIDHRRFLTSGFGWLIPDPEAKGRYRRTKLWPNMKSQHPRVYAQIAADASKWMLPASSLNLAESRQRARAEQGALL